MSKDKKNNREEKDMATETLKRNYTLNEHEAQKILSTPRTIIKQSNVFNDIHLSKKERVAYAKNILKSRKCK
jgi:hypothetical protein